MHETSIAKRLLTQVLRLAVEHTAVTVDAVTVHIGEFAGIEPALLGSAFSQLAVGTIAAGASIEMRIVPLTVRCAACQREFAPDGFRFQCEYCPGAEVEITAGEELVLDNVILAQGAEVDTCH
jgi:hydrogenase nickel incorporation protein HypA/HybF